jgi:D-lactate dehydrogenase
VVGDWLPAWNEAMPRAAPATRLETIRRGKGRQVVYFPSCIARTMGAARSDTDGRAIFEATLSLLGKADYDVIFPEALDSLCCGLAFDSKGFREVADAKSEELERALAAASEGGRIPILCDTSPCLQRMRKKMDPKLVLLEPAEFIHDHLLDKVSVRKLPDKVAVHVTCSSTKMGVGGKLEAVARACAAEVVIPPRVGCCGFAGDRGFSHPELNAAALSELASGVKGCTEGVSNSRTCEIGLMLHAGIPYRSIVFLADRAASRKG